jgi:hypothetical protein
MERFAKVAQKRSKMDKPPSEPLFKSDATDTDIERISRPWEPISNFSWCSEQRIDDEPGLLYVKLLKTGSSTLVGINMRTAEHVGRRAGLEEGICSRTYLHGGRARLLGRQTPSLLWSSIRRCQNFITFLVASRNVQPTDELVAAFLTSARAYQFKYLVDNDDSRNWAPPQKAHLVASRHASH